MDSESLIKPFVGRLVSGSFAIILISLMVFFQNDSIRVDIKPVLKGPRPLKRNITATYSGNSYSHLKTSNRESIFHSIILEAADRYNVDPALVKAVIMAESGYDPTAISKKGAMGLMQLMPATGIAMGVEDFFDPEHNVNAGVKYLKKLLNQFDGNLLLAVAAYNAGSTKVRKYQGIPPYKATRIYVKKVFEYYKHYQGNMI